MVRHTAVAVLGEPLRAAESRGVSVPHLRMLYQLLRLVDDGRIAAAAEPQAGRILAIVSAGLVRQMMKETTHRKGRKERKDLLGFLCGFCGCRGGGAA